MGLVAMGQGRSRLNFFACHRASLPSLGLQVVGGGHGFWLLNGDEEHAKLTSGRRCYIFIFTVSLASHRQIYNLYELAYDPVTIHLPH